MKPPAAKHLGLSLRIFVAIGNAYRRLLAVFIAVAGPRISYALTGALARLIYRSLEPLRARTEAQCRAAIGTEVSADRVPRIAEQSFVHRVWNLTDLMLADRLLHRGTCARYGGRIPEPHLGVLLEAQRRRHPLILVTAYYGPYDLLPVFLGYNDIRAGVVYRRHANDSFDAFRSRVRRRGGCELIAVERAASRLPQILEEGGTIAILADHHAERRGLPVTFLGLPTTAMRSVGLLAERYGAAVAIAGIRRLREPFRFQLVVSGILMPDQWKGSGDPVPYITEYYLRALERMILDDPAQYLWAQARWGEAFARDLVTTGSSDGDVA